VIIISHKRLITPQVETTSSIEDVSGGSDTTGASLSAAESAEERMRGTLVTYGQEVILRDAQGLRFLTMRRGSFGMWTAVGGQFGRDGGTRGKTGWKKRAVYSLALRQPTMVLTPFSPSPQPGGELDLTTVRPTSGFRVMPASRARSEGCYNSLAADSARSYSVSPLSGSIYCTLLLPCCAVRLPASYCFTFFSRSLLPLLRFSFPSSTMLSIFLEEQRKNTDDPHPTPPLPSCLYLFVQVMPSAVETTCSYYTLPPS